MRLIDADFLQELIYKRSDNLRNDWTSPAVILAVDAQPTVDAVEVVHGNWEKEHDFLGIVRGWKCSHCKGSVYEMTYEPYQHCPHCGTKMDGKGDKG